jgi:hypothetical protein
MTTLRERGDALAEAVRLAPERGAATLVRVGRFEALDFALVLEPEAPLAQARSAFAVCMGALASAIALHAPPQRALTIRWPDAFLLDGVIHGGARLVVPPDAREDAPPDWLVFAAEIMLEAPKGEIPLAMSLAEAGLETVDPLAVLSDFCAHLLAAEDRRAHLGLDAAAEPYLSRLDFGKAGWEKRLDPSGDVFAGPPGALTRHALAPALASARWRTEMGLVV